MPPAAAAGALAGGGAALGIGAGVIASATGAGKSKFTPKGYGASPDYDPNRFEYGGRPGGADEAANRYRGIAGAHQGAHAGLLNESWENRQRALQSRGKQDEIATLMEQRARGRNLISTQIANRNRNIAARDIHSKARSARGVAGLAEANQMEADATGAAAGNITEQELIAGMEEQRQAETTAFGARTGMREQDIGTSGQTLQGAGQEGQLGLGYTGAEQNVRGTQANLNAAQQSAMAASHNQGQQLEAGIQGANAQQDMEYIKMGLGGISGGSQAGAQAYAAGQPPAGGGGKPASDPLAKTGISGLGPSPMSGPATSSLDVLDSRGGLDVNASLKAHSNVATQFQGDPSGGMGGSFSDPKAKSGVKKLGEGGSHRAAMSMINEEMLDPRERHVRDPETFERHTVSGVMPPSDVAIKRAYKEKEALRLLHEAEALEQAMKASLAKGPSVGPVDDGGEIVRDDEALAMKREADDTMSGYKTSLREGSSVGPSDKPPAWLEAAMADEGPTPDFEIDEPDDRLAISGPTAKMGMQPLSDPKAKQEAYELGMQHGSAITSERMITGKINPNFTSPYLADAHKADAKEEPAPTPPPPLPPAEERPRRIMQSDRQERIQRRALAIANERMTRTPPGPPPGEQVGAGPYATPGLSPVPGVSMPVRPASDPRAKALGGVHSNEVAKTLDETPAVSYKYKSPEYEPDAQRPGERQAGFLTTDLKRTPLGAAVVEKRPDGLEGYNPHRLDGLQHAEIRNLHERLRELEAMVARKKAG